MLSFEACRRLALLAIGSVGRAFCLEGRAGNGIVYVHMGQTTPSLFGMDVSATDVSGGVQEKHRLGFYVLCALDSVH